MWLGFYLHSLITEATFQTALGERATISLPDGADYLQLQLKLALILLAGINMAAFHSSAHRKIVERDELHLPLPGHVQRAHGEISHKDCNCGHGGVRPLAVFANRVAASAIKSTPTGVRR